MNTTTVRCLAIYCVVAAVVLGSAMRALAFTETTLKTESGQRIGTVQAYVLEDAIFVTIETGAEWELAKMDLEAGANHKAFPKDWRGRARASAFSYHAEGRPGQSFYYFEIPNDWPDANEVCLAVRVIVSPNTSAHGVTRASNAQQTGRQPSDDGEKERSEFSKDWDGWQKWRWKKSSHNPEGAWWGCGGCFFNWSWGFPSHGWLYSHDDDSPSCKNWRTGSHGWDREDDDSPSKCRSHTIEAWAGDKRITPCDWATYFCAETERD